MGLHAQTCSYMVDFELRVRMRTIAIQITKTIFIPTIDKTLPLLWEYIYLGYSLEKYVNKHL